MQGDTATLIAVISAVIAGLALLWGIYTHISTRKIAKLTYTISQLSDFGVPASFLADMPHAPMAITITSRGNRGTENVVLRLKTTSPIENFEVWPEELPITQENNVLVVRSARLNPSQKIKLFLRCIGDAQENQIDELEISHSEGAGISEKDMATITFEFFGIRLEYDPLNLKTHISQIGPFSFG